MKAFKILGRGVQRTLLLILLPHISSCTMTQKWQHEKCEAYSSEYSSKRILFQPNNNKSSLDIELVTDIHSQKMYVNLHSLPIAEDPNYPGKVSLVICIENDKHKILADRFQGGQRLLLSEYGRDLILDSLKKNQPVAITTGRYSCTITPNGL